MERPIITVFGGSGFIGRHLVRRLAAENYIVRVAVRDPDSAAFLKPMGKLGQIVPMAADIGDPATVRAAVDNASAVVNLVGVLYESGRQSFRKCHVDGARNIAKAAAEAGAGGLVHISAIGANSESESEYARTKAAGESAVLAEFPQAVIIRPSIVFGPEDFFFNMFAGFTRLSPSLPVFGCDTIPKITYFGDENLVDIDFYGRGGTHFQPVFVGDIAQAITCGLGESSHRGKLFELGGPKVYSSKEMMELLLQAIGRKRILWPAPFWLLLFYAWFLEKLPKPFLTRDQVKLLKTDNVVSEGALTFADLGLTPAAAEAILPTYLARYRLAGRQFLKEA